MINKEKIDPKLEWLKCKKSPHYFIHKYVFVPEAGGGKFKYNLHDINPKILRVIDSVFYFNFCIFFASRQLGKSSIAASLILWATIFYKGQTAMIIHLKKDAAMSHLKVVRFIYDNLPSFLKVPLKSKSELKTYIEFSNNSIIKLFYPSSQADPNTIGRSLTSPIIFGDEIAFISHFDVAFSSAQPAFSKAHEQAKKNKSPTFLLLSSTPNGVEGNGKFFYDLYSNAIKSDDIFDENNKINSDAKNHIELNSSKNNYILVEYHWSEDKTKTIDWYKQQCRLMNFDMRKINQEYNLKFLSSSNCIFPDSFLEKLEAIPPIEKYRLPHYSYFKLYKEVNELDAYILSIDSATSLTGDYCAIELFNFSKFEQIGEFTDRIGSVIKYTELIKEIIRYILTFISKERLIVTIENNPGGSGNSIIELLLNDTSYDYADLLYFDKNKNHYGVYTTRQLKDIYISVFNDYVIDNPHLIHSQDLISQFSNIGKSYSGNICANGKNHDDLFMASVIAAYTRKDKLLEYGKYINNQLLTEEKIVKIPDEFKDLEDKSIVNLIKLEYINRKKINEEDKIYYSSEKNYTIDNDDFYIDII